jgi:glyoxylase-like metal-dependent hydrolase (beta-lactamase superfamily II)
MLNIKRFVCNMIRENCYVVNDETKECVIIDCGAYYPEERKAVTDYISEKELVPKHLICTHGHLDHNFGDDTIFKEYHLRPECGAGDADFMKDLNGQGKDIFNMDIHIDYPEVDHYFKEDEVVKFGNHTFRVMLTPGHSEGGVTFICDEEHLAFTGDTLFKGSIGRTDFKGGSMFKIIQSLRHLSQLPDETRIFPGHGQDTTIGRELAQNPYMDR